MAAVGWVGFELAATQYVSDVVELMLKRTTEFSEINLQFVTVRQA